MATPQQAGRVQAEVVAVAGGLTFHKSVVVPVGQTLGWAVNASGLYALHPQLKEAALGVWGKVLPAATLVNAHDRIEVYTPVLKSATTAHRQRLQARKLAAKVAP
jgi:putative ubiquitin-RnfH superfamily antitoxin RatB of RatAB toxin-antitoxin module